MSADIQGLRQFFQSVVNLAPFSTAHLWTWLTHICTHTDTNSTTFPSKPGLDNNSMSDYSRLRLLNLIFLETGGQFVVTDH